MKNLKLSIEIDLEAITKAVEDSKTLEDNELLFGKLSAFAFDKKQVEVFNEAFENVERMVKQVINDKAKALYGSNWTAIKGSNYKITRSLTGSVYQILDVDKVPEDILKVKIDIDSKKVNDYVKANSKLPEGLTVNPNRSESIRLSVTPNDNKA